MGDTLVDVENMDPLWGLCAWGLCAWACTCAHGYAQVCHGLNIIRRGMCMSMRKGVCLQVCGGMHLHTGVRIHTRVYLCGCAQGHACIREDAHVQ